MISSRNIKLLKPFQKIYLIFSIIIWFSIVILYFTKLAAIILLKILNKKFHCEKKIKKILLLSWAITNVSAYFIIFIAFIYDIVQILKGNIYYILYECIICTIYIIYICFSINDYYHLQIIYYFICKKLEIKKEEKKTKVTEITETKIEEDEYEFDIKAIGKKLFESADKLKPL